jgi:aryl-alcohol dehydrogenase-like predicted oxidoreductase
VDYAQGLAAVEEIKKLFPAESSLSALALRWILMFSQVSTVIPGASRPEQVLANVLAMELPALTEEQMQGIRSIYQDRIWPLIANEAW